MVADARCGSVTRWSTTGKRPASHNFLRDIGADSCRLLVLKARNGKSHPACANRAGARAPLNYIVPPGIRTSFPELFGLIRMTPLSNCRQVTMSGDNLIW